MPRNSSELVARYLLDALASKAAKSPANSRDSVEVHSTDAWTSQFNIDLDGFGAYERFAVIVKAID